MGLSDRPWTHTGLPPCQTEKGACPPAGCSFPASISKQKLPWSRCNSCENFTALQWLALALTSFVLDSDRSHRGYLHPSFPSSSGGSLLCIAVAGQDGKRNETKMLDKKRQPSSASHRDRRPMAGLATISLHSAQLSSAASSMGAIRVTITPPDCQAGRTSAVADSLFFSQHCSRW